jgi:Na+/proline symporter
MVTVAERDTRVRSAYRIGFVTGFACAVIAACVLALCLALFSGSSVHADSGSESYQLSRVANALESMRDRCR